MASNELSGDSGIPAITGENTAGGDGIVGKGRRGVVGTSDSFQGVFGHSVDNAGVVGEADNFHAVFGISHSVHNAGVIGGNDGGGFGVIGTGHIGVNGESTDGGDGVVGKGRRGVVGDSPDFQGVFGHSGTNAGVVGESEQFHAVFGISHSANNGGIFGTNTAGGFSGVFDGRLAVVNIECRGDIQMLGGDIAEDFDAEDGPAILPGSVVRLGASGHVGITTSQYDTAVIGIVAGAPGFRPGLRLDRAPTLNTRVPVTLMGKVMCLVDATSAPVKAGDLLTSSATPGHAMKVATRGRSVGAIVGKALRSLEHGRGLVPVLAVLR